MHGKPTIKPYLDDEERQFIKQLEADTTKFKSVMTPASRKALVEAARATMNAEREKITLRISRRDLARLKSRALQEGMPYQTLINSILHKAVSYRRSLPLNYKWRWRTSSRVAPSA